MLKRLIIGIVLLGSTGIFVTSVNAQATENQKISTQGSRHQKDFTKLKTELGLTIPAKNPGIESEYFIDRRSEKSTDEGAARC